jgi:hypothetical protein
MQIVIPGLTRNPVFFRIPAFAGMTRYVVVYDAMYDYKNRVVRKGNFYEVWFIMGNRYCVHKINPAGVG